MTIEQPPEDADIDWEAICAANAEAEELDAGHTLSPERFRVIWAKAKAAAGEHLEVLETLRMLAPAGLDLEAL